jgi:hypothetical protein
MIFDGVAPDRYWITAHTIIRDHEHWAMKAVDVSEQPISTTLVLEPDAILTGSVALEKAGSKSTPALTTISIFFRPADGLATAAQSTGIRTTSVEGDGRFVIQLPPGRYIVEAPVAGWTLARAVVNGRDTLASPIAVRAGTTLTAELTLAPR